MNYVIPEKMKIRIDDFIKQFYKDFNELVKKRKMLHNKLVNEYNKKTKSYLNYELLELKLKGDNEELNDTIKLTRLYFLGKESGIDMLDFEKEEKLKNKIKEFNESEMPKIRAKKYNKIRKYFKTLNKEYGGEYFAAKRNGLTAKNKEYIKLKKDIEELTKNSIKEFEQLKHEGLDKVICNIEECIINNLKTEYKVNHPIIKKIILKNTICPIPKNNQIKAMIDLRVKLTGIIDFEIDDKLEFGIKYNLERMKEKLSRIYIKRKFNEKEITKKIKAPEIGVNINLFK